jgi:3-oxoacyl-[acyl-carrier protein] reductase
MGRLSGKFALVTGGSRGIGRGIALEFAREGASVAVNYRRDEPAARATAEAIERLGGGALAVQADVAEWPHVERMVADVLAVFGRLDVVVANSGIASRTQTVWDMDIEHWHRVLAVDGGAWM